MVNSTAGGGPKTQAQGTAIHDIDQPGVIFLEYPDFSTRKVSSYWILHMAEQGSYSGLILGLCQANERRRYKVTPSIIGWAQT